MYYNNKDFDKVLLTNDNLINTEPHKTNLVLHTRYILTDTNTMLTLYILQGESGKNYLCDIGSVLDTAEDLDLSRKIVVDNANKFGLKIENEKIYCEIDPYNIEKQLQNFIDFAKHLGLI